MDTITVGQSIAMDGSAQQHLPLASEVGMGESAGVASLNVETFASNPTLPADRKWALRFRSDGTVTIVLGMRSYGRGWFSGYFAGLVTARLGVPFRRVRLYYSGTLPAVLQTPTPPSTFFHRGQVGPIASAVADIIERMCDEVIERGRLAFAAMAGVGAVDIGFDQSMGRFFVLNRAQSGALLEMAGILQGELSASTECARKHQQGDKVSPGTIRVPAPAKDNTVCLDAISRHCRT